MDTLRTTPLETESSLPSYIKHPGLSRSTTLEIRGGLTLPPVVLRDRILRAFADFVYPYMPVVHFQRIVNAIDHGDGTDAVHLLLFQAIMFAGVAHVELHHLQRHGYCSHRSARREFFERVDTCYDVFVQVETDPIILIQSLLFMTFWYDPAANSIDSYERMRVILSLSRTLGIHDDSGGYCRRDHADYHLWRRIAWFTYVRDRMILLGARRPASIDPADFKLSLLTADDFELAAVDDIRPSCLPEDCQLFRDTSRLQHMAELCVQQTKLSLCIDQVVSIQRGVETSHVTGPADTSISAILACDDRLRKWWSEVLGGDVKFAQPWSEYRQGDESAMVQRTMLHLAYYTLVSALHRPLARMLAEDSLSGDAQSKKILDQTCREALDNATDETTRLACHIYRLNLWGFLPAVAVTALLSAIIRHITNIGSKKTNLKDSSLLGFGQCLRLIAQLQDVWANADEVYTFLDSAIGQIRVNDQLGSYEVMELSNICESTRRRPSAGDLSFPARAAVPNDDVAWFLEDPSSSFDAGLRQFDLQSASYEHDSTYSAPFQFSPNFIRGAASHSDLGSIEENTTLNIDDILQLDTRTADFSSHGIFAGAVDDHQHAGITTDANLSGFGDPIQPDISGIPL